MWTHRASTVGLIVLLALAPAVPAHANRAGNAAVRAADTPTVTVDATCDTDRGQWRVGWHIWPHGPTVFNVQASTVPPTTSGSYYGLLGPEEDGPRVASSLLLPVGVSDATFAVRYWPVGGDPAANLSFTQVDNLGVCKAGRVFPLYGYVMYCGGEVGLDISNQAVATLDAQFRVTASDGFDMQYRVAPGEKRTLYFRPPLPYPIDIYESGVRLAGVPPWYANEGCAIGRGPYCPCLSGVPPVPGPPGGGGPTGGGSGGGGGAGPTLPDGATTAPTPTASSSLTNESATSVATSPSTATIAATAHGGAPGIGAGPIALTTGSLGLVLAVGALVLFGFRRRARAATITDDATTD